MAKKKQTRYTAKPAPSANVQRPQPPAKLTELEAREYLTQYIRKLMGLMELTDWRLKLSDEPCAIGNYASIVAYTSQREAVMHLAWNWRTYGARITRETITHELIHLHCEPTMEYARKCSADSDWNAIKYLNEYTVDAIARVIDPFLPLPDSEMFNID